MVIRIVKYAFIALLILVVGLFLVVTVSSRLAMDDDLAHTSSSKALNDFSPGIGDGIVNIAANDMSFRARVAGFDATDKQTVILLHGFPVTSAMWIDLIDPLAQAGFQVVAFDQRGYSPGARPSDLSAYELDKLTLDVTAIADAVGADKFHLVGHDWGAAVGWSTVLSHPERILSWTGLSIAHPAAFGEALNSDPDQQARSGYFAFFQTPWLPETLFSFNGFSLLAGLYQPMTAEKRTEYISVFSEPGALTAALNWYRAMESALSNPNNLPTDVTAPTLFIWGNQDDAVGRVAIDAMAAYMKGPYRSIETDAGHWLLTDEPQRVVNEVLKHVIKYSE